MGEDTRIDSASRADRAQQMATEMAAREQVEVKQPSRKELSQQAFDQGVESLTFSLTAPVPVQIWHLAKSGVVAVHGQPSPPLASEVTGVRLYPLIEKDLPKTIRSDGVSGRAGEFTLHAQIARSPDGKETVAYYTAVRHGRAEFAVGKDAVELFKAHPDIYAQQADYDWGITHARPYQQDTYRSGESISNRDYKGAVVHGYQSWEHALRDPTWAAQRAVDGVVATAVPEVPEGELGEVRPQAAPVRGEAPTAAKAAPAPRSLTAIETRDWYHARLSEIDGVETQMRSEGKSSKEIFEVTTKLRNDAKMQARELMADQALAQSLPPPMTPEQVLKKYDGDYEAAIAASKRSNAAVDQSIETRRRNGEK